jgi:hypothetical protein
MLVNIAVSGEIVIQPRDGFALGFRMRQEAAA